jgi:hypothetical protein
MDVQRHLLSKLIHDQAISVAVAGKHCIGCWEKRLRRTRLMTCLGE